MTLIRAETRFLRSDILACFSYYQRIFIAAVGLSVLKGSSLQVAECFGMDVTQMKHLNNVC